MKKTILIIICIIAMGIMGITPKTFATQAKTTKKPAAQNVLSPGVAKYRSQNYIGAMQDFEDVLAKNPDNSFAQYYLALCHTQLGHKEKAEKLYQKVINGSNNHMLVAYSKKATECLKDPNSEGCNPIKAKSDEERAEMKDIETFLGSGQRIHPSAQDRIMKEKMQERLERIEYLKEQEARENLKSDNSQPTNEEIASALNTLSKIGMNPFNQNPYQMLSQGYNQPQGYNPYTFLMQAGLTQPSDLAQNSDYPKMMLYGQMLNSMNSFGGQNTTRMGL